MNAKKSTDQLRFCRENSAVDSLHPLRISYALRERSLGGLCRERKTQMTTKRKLSSI